MTISAARHGELLNAQSAIARKVFEVVPIQQAWTSQAIGGALQQQTRSSMQFRTLEGCLNTLKDAGLIYEPTPGHFQRVTPRETLRAVPKTEDEPPRVVGAVELLNELAARARMLADDLDAAASVIAEEQANNVDSARKLQQLQTILKSL
jgi:hypothetical protein